MLILVETCFDIEVSVIHTEEITIMAEPSNIPTQYLCNKPARNNQTPED